MSSTTKSYAGSAKIMALAILALTIGLVSLLSATEPASASGYKMTHAAAAQKLKSAGLTWSSSGNCSNRYSRYCTSFEQINSHTIDGIIGFKIHSRCAINVTGGTEVGHATMTYSHWNGYKIDISPTSCVNNYIRLNYRYLGTRSDGALLYQPRSAYPWYGSAASNPYHKLPVFARESNHWDITYY